MSHVSAHDILKPGFTRWLTLGPCAVRIIDQFNPLVLFFTSLVNDYPTENNMKLLTMLKDPFTKCYLEFLVKILDKFNKFNATFQSNKPLLYLLREYVYNFILDLSRCFMSGAYVNSFKSNPMKIDQLKTISLFASKKHLHR